MWADAVGRERRPGVVTRLAALLAMACAITVVLALTRATTPVPRLWSGPQWYLDLRPGQPFGVTGTDGALTDLGWVLSGRVPGAGSRFEAMTRAALLDLHRLTAADGAVSAGAGERWEHVWPRDTAFVAVAFAATGHRDDALAALDWLARRQAADGGFEARYRRDGAGSPDTRPRQDDGPAWFLWALASVGPGPGGRYPGLGPAAARSADRLLELTDDGRRLPPVTPDYWEVPQDTVSLGLAASVLAGLRAAPTWFEAAGDRARAERARAAGRRFAAVVRDAFAPSWQRYGDRGGRDAALTFLLPPFGPSDPAVLAALADYEAGALRPAGGLAPGTGWRKHGESWTPETALVAWSHAVRGDRVSAQLWLDWLDATRTPWGSLPEKVLTDGSPAGPAPLAWTAALVVLTVAQLDPDSEPAPVRR